MIILFPKNVWYRKLLSYIFRWAIRQIINYIFLSQVIEYLTQVKLKGTPGYDKLNFIDCQWLVKTNGATFIFIEKLGNTFLLGLVWPCPFFASLSVPSGMALSPDFLCCGPKLRPLCCCNLNLCGDGVRRWGLNVFHQLLSQLRILPFNSKIIS